MPVNLLETTGYKLFLYPRNGFDGPFFKLVDRRRADDASARPLSRDQVLDIQNGPNEEIQVTLGGVDLGNAIKSKEVDVLKQVAEFASSWKLALSGADDAGSHRQVSALNLRDKFLIEKKDDILEHKDLDMRVVTWNVQGKSTQELDLKPLVGSPQILVWCIQESDTLGRNLYANATTLNSMSEQVLQSFPKGEKYHKVDANQLLGLMIIVFAHETVMDQITVSSKATTGTGLFGRIGNKGACGISLFIGNDPLIPDSGTELILVNCHLSAGEDVSVLNRRRWELEEIGSQFGFSSKTSDAKLFDEDAPELENSDLEGHVENIKPSGLLKKLILLVGDLNYRLDMDKKLAKDLMESKDYETLLVHDLLEFQRKEGKVLKGFLEGDIQFPPTYKYDGDQLNDQRTPSYCDRILYQADESGLSQTSYGSDGTYILSDHKPVFADFKMKVEWIDNEKRHSIVNNAFKRFDMIENSQRANVTVDNCDIKGPEGGRNLLEQEIWITLTNDESKSPCLASWNITSNDDLIKIQPSSGVLPLGDTQRIRVAVTIPVGTKDVSDVLILRIKDVKDIFIAVSFTTTVESVLGEKLNSNTLHAISECVAYLDEQDITGVFEKIISPAKFTFNRKSIEDLMPTLCFEVVRWMDSGLEFDHQVLDEANKHMDRLGTRSVAQMLIMVLYYLPEKLIPKIVYQKCLKCAPQEGHRKMWEILDSQPAMSLNSDTLQIVLSYFRRIVHNQQAVPKKVIVDVLEPVMFDDAGKPANNQSLLMQREEKNQRKRLLSELILRSLSAI